MIQIYKYVNGKVERIFEFYDKSKAKQAYKKFQDRFDCYALVVVDGVDLNTAQARKYFCLPKISCPKL